jgi:hypothetical protein
MAIEKKDIRNYDFASTDLLIYIWEKRIPLAIIGFAAAVLSIIVSFTITPLFRSTVIMFPTANASISKNLLADNYGGRYSIYEIGEEDQAEQLLQVLNSEEIKNKIVKKYDLLKHYKIDTTSKFPQTELEAAYRGKVHFKRTEFMSVQVEVLDKDPQMAADIANDIAAFTDTVFNDILKQRAIQAYQLVEKEYNDLLDSMKFVKDSLDAIRALGVNYYSTQSERYHEAYGKALISGNTQAMKTLDEKLKMLSKYGGSYDVLTNELNFQVSVLSRLNQRRSEAKVEAEQTLPHKFLVDKAFKAEKKVYPKKSVIVIVSVIGALLLGLLALILNDNLKRKLK